MESVGYNKLDDFSIAFLVFPVGYYEQYSLFQIPISPLIVCDANLVELQKPRFV